MTRLKKVCNSLFLNASKKFIQEASERPDSYSKKGIFAVAPHGVRFLKVIFPPLLVLRLNLEVIFSKEQRAPTTQRRKNRKSKIENNSQYI
jgi:hypothetical protein